jgi:SH3-like domain-containing protein
MRHGFASVLALSIVASPLSAQVELGVSGDVRARPGGTTIASLMPGTRLTTGAVSGSETQVTFEGWVDASRLGAKRDSFPASVSGRLTLRVRATPSPRGAIIAVLQPGTGLHTISRQGTWARVRRTAWMSTSTLNQQPVPVIASSPQPASRGTAAIANRPTPSAGPGPATVVAPPPANPGPAARAGNAFVASTGARFRDLPVGKVLGGLTAGSSVEVVARQNGWVRVRADGWVPEKELVDRDTTVRPDVSAADLRADPQGHRGRMVQWEVEVMSLQIADPLRLALQRDEPYLLVRGPGAENTIIYLAVPQSLLAEVRALPPLSRVHVTARVRNARSEPAGTPVLDLLSIGKR